MSIGILLEQTLVSIMEKKNYKSPTMKTIQLETQTFIAESGQGSDIGWGVKKEGELGERIIDWDLNEIF